MLKLILWFIYFSIMLFTHFVALIIGVVQLIRGGNPVEILVYLLLSFMTYFFSKDTAEAIKNKIDGIERERHRTLKSSPPVKEGEVKPPRPFKKGE
jgi:membrane protein implicated in regulation of membrane protease activity